MPGRGPGALRARSGQFAPQDGQIQIQIDWSMLEDVVERAGTAIEDLQAALLEELKANLERESPEAEGRLKSGWRIEGDQVVNIWEYTQWVIAGTGIYGPRGAPIVPVRAKALRFELDGEVVFRTSVRGSPPNPFPEKAKDQTAEQADAILGELLTKAGVA